MIHWINILIPWSGDFSGSRIVFTMSIKISLSVRVLFGSFKPGVSINVILPLVAILTFEVTAVNDFDASKRISTYVIFYISL